MSDFRPFRALRFARDPEPRLAPPWDVISPEERERLASQSENVVHLTLPPGKSGERDYASARAVLERWKRDGVVIEDAQDQLYVLVEHTTDGRTRTGFLGALRLADYEERIVLPHERTMAGAKLDRLLLTREVRANLEPLFFLYEDRDAKLGEVLAGAAKTEALVTARGPDGTGLELYALPDADAIAFVRSFLGDLPVVIADGHHRYETMRTYRDEQRKAAPGGADAGHEFVMAYLVNAFDPGSAVQAIHRVLRGDVAALDGVLQAAGFDVRTVPATDGDALVGLLAEHADTHSFVFLRPGGEAVLATRARGESLDVEVLHADVLPGLGGDLSFDARPQRLLETLRASGAALGILLNPTDPDSLFRVVQAGQVLPQKSTFFTPKIPSGLVLREF